MSNAYCKLAYKISFLIFEGVTPKNSRNLFEKYIGSYPRSSAMVLIGFSVETRAHRALHNLIFVEKADKEIPENFLNKLESQPGEKFESADNRLRE